MKSDLTMEKSEHLDEGDACPEKCGGTLHYLKPVNCSCRISPPCSSCTDVKITCNYCGWEEEYTFESAPESAQKAPSTEWWRRKKGSHDFGNGKRIFDYDYDSSSGSTMVYTGRYEGDVTAADIIAVIGDGTFGHRGPFMDNGRFTYTKITD